MTTNNSKQMIKKITISNKQKFVSSHDMEQQTDSVRFLFQINRCMVNTIWFLFDLTSFRYVTVRLGSCCIQTLGPQWMKRKAQRQEYFFAFHAKHLIIMLKCAYSLVSIRVIDTFLNCSFVLSGKQHLVWISRYTVEKPKFETRL